MENHISYNKLLKHPHDFEVEYQILTESEGGRKTLPYQGIRWDFWYDYNGIHEGHLFMIWPEFLNDKGNVITQKNTPVSSSGRARMWIINDGLRKYHQDKIKIGMNANGYEGNTLVVKYLISKIVGLITNPLKEIDL
ncbi:hypothetical protein PG911_06805 [Tenacibaculum ovolyticum]|uniref:hypothetical protein n=1 Tax=Tenacibaculum ovolyticum TaxID=104270 RepID=UPI0007EC3127|nr:hypothetical protein [Tenacibaculum ovolyticum]WBX77959.1 hypothetical protein PG911_06805 [Tenacibaculum ovolyticum]